MVQLMEVISLTKAQAFIDSNIFPRGTFSTPTDVTVIASLERDTTRKPLQYGFSGTKLAAMVAEHVYILLLSGLLEQYATLN